MEELKISLQTARARANLDLVHAACRNIKSQTDIGKLANFRYSNIVAEIERLPLEVREAAAAAKAGGPSVNTLGSPAGLHFRKLIAAWKGQEDELPVAEATTRRKGFDYRELLLAVANPATRSIIGSLLAEGDVAKAELNTLKARTSLQIDLRLRDGSSLARTSTPSLVSSEPNLLDSEIVALSQPVDQAFLQRKGLKIGPEGQLQTGDGRTIFSAGFESGLRKLLRHVQTEPPTLSPT